MPTIDDNKLEILLDKIAEALILDVEGTGLINRETVIKNQKVIRQGLIQNKTNLNDSTPLVLYQKDIKANVDDLEKSKLDGENIETLRSIADSIIDINTLQVSLASLAGGILQVNVSADAGSVAEDVSELIMELTTETIDGVSYDVQKSINVSQFIPLEQSSSIVDVDTANEFLDTTIYELLPSGDTRQARINKFFQELNTLLPPELPNFDKDEDGFVDRMGDGGNQWDSGSQYDFQYSIATAQETDNSSDIDEEDAYIHRLKNLSGGQVNANKTIEDIYNSIRPFLSDILEISNIPEDSRNIYRNQSSGYLKLRNLNQGIIIRNTQQDFVEGLDPNNPTWLRQSNGDVGTGFTVTMWVRFLDKVSTGTLFNYGNPLREENPFGFRLDTYVIGPDELTNFEADTSTGYIPGFTSVRDNHPNGMMFQNTDTERFVRLIAYDDVTQKVHDSHFGLGTSTVGNDGHYNKRPFITTLGNPSRPAGGYNQFDRLGLLSNTRVPMDFQEWYFICATFNPNVYEPQGDFDLGGSSNNQGSPELFYEDYAGNYDFWMNHINPEVPGVKVINSEYGNKCKVEIISRSDLLRARGFKVD